MSAADDPLFLAVDELNRRMVRSHRRMTLMTSFASVAAGVASVARLVAEAGVAETGPHVLAATLLLTTLATFSAGAFLSRLLLRRRRDTWVRELSRRFQADPTELLSYALPFGGAPEGAGKAKTSRAKIALAAVLVASSVVVLAARTESVIFDLAVVVVSVSFAVAFNRYLGWRAPA